MNERSDIEMAFIRILSVHGLILSGAISEADRRERIRVAILQQGLTIKPFGDGRTYSEAYRECYGSALDLRRASRDHDKKPVEDPAIVAEEAVDDDEEEEEDVNEAETRLFRHAS